MASHEFAGPPGFQHIETAPHDGAWVRLRFRPGFGREEIQVLAQWQVHDEMPAGGAWFDIHARYVTPGPIFWRPTTWTPERGTERINNITSPTEAKP